MHEEFGDKGLTVLAVTRAKEDRKKTAEWIANLGAEYSYAYAKDNALYEACGVKGIPSAALVSADGEILWTGSPYSLSSGKVKSALKGASKSYTFGWGKPYAAAAKLLVEGKYAKALAAVAKVGAKGDENAAVVRKSILAKLDRRVGMMEDALKKGDFLASLTIAEALDGQLDGLDQAARVKTTFESIDSNEEAKVILEGQRKLAKIKAVDLKKSKQMQTAMKKANKLGEKYAGTIVEEQAEQFSRSINARLLAKRGM